MTQRGAILNTDTRLIPTKANENEYFVDWGKDHVYYVFEKNSGRRILVTSAGDLGVPVGTCFDMYADQSGRPLGLMRLVVIVTAADIATLPDKSYPLYTFK